MAAPHLDVPNKGSEAALQAILASSKYHVEELSIEPEAVCQVTEDHCDKVTRCETSGERTQQPT
jgi:hypothetical protein